MEIGQQIQAQARTWLGTPFQHQGRVKNIGCDCIGLIIGVAKELELRNKDGQLLSDFDKQGYSRIPYGRGLKYSLDNCMQEIGVSDISAGDIILLRFRRDPQHLAIVTQYNEQKLGIIHCYCASAKVVEHRLDDRWKKRIVSAYRL